MTGVAGKYEGLQFISIDHVDASGIKSQWQAHFLQVFPFRYGELPATNFSDKECFEKNWEGDIHTTYEQFVNKGNTRILRLNVRREYWEQVQRGEKIYEYRLCNEYWKIRLEEKIFSYIAYCIGYPKKGDMSKILLRKWKGYEKGIIEHKEFGGKAEVYKIPVDEPYV